MKNRIQYFHPFLESQFYPKNERDADNEIMVQLSAKNIYLSSKKVEEHEKMQL